MDFGTVNFEDLFDFSPEPLDSANAEVQRQNEMYAAVGGGYGVPQGGEKEYYNMDGGGGGGGGGEQQQYSQGGLPVQGRQVGPQHPPAYSQACRTQQRFSQQELVIEISLNC